MADITFKIKEHIAVLQEKKDGWQKELTLCDWNQNGPKYDIRDWSPDYSKMGRGITLSQTEMDIILTAMERR